MPCSCHKARAEVRGAESLRLVPLLHSMIFTNARPHRELGDSVRLLLAAGADFQKTITFDGDELTALMCAADSAAQHRSTCCFKQAHPCTRSAKKK
jgi:hypothetical protein